MSRCIERAEDGGVERGRGEGVGREVRRKKEGCCERRNEGEIQKTSRRKRSDRKEKVKRKGCIR